MRNVPLILAIWTLGTLIPACSDDGLGMDYGILAIDVAIDTGEPPSDGEGDLTTDVSVDVPMPADLAGPDIAPSDTFVDVAPPDWWGEVVTAKANEWQWVDFPGTFCGDGTATGLGINLSPGATRVVIVFEGGGACWDYATCKGIIETSFHLEGFGASDFNSLIISVYKNMLLLDRDEPKNPFADAHYVFLPYCTGDVFSGDRVVELKGLLPFNKATLHFKGAHNVGEYLKRLVPTFQDVTEVYLVGSSAGGFGAGLNWFKTREAFAPIPVHVIDDSAPPISPAGGRWEQWKEAWNMQFPAECPNCGEGMDAVMDFFKSEMLTTGKLALITYANDSIISTFLGLPFWDFTKGVEHLVETFDESANANYFILPGLLHTTLLAQDKFVEGPGGTPLWFWLTQMVHTEANWTSIQP